MTFTRRAGTALAIAGSALTLAAATPRVFSPGYTYRMKIDSHVTEPNGKTKDYVVMSGRASVNAHGGRLDIEEAATDKGARGEKGGYILYDATSMMSVSTSVTMGLSRRSSVPGLNERPMMPMRRLRLARMALADGAGYVDASGKAEFAYAHPLFWAPYTIIGDGGRR